MDVGVLDIETTGFFGARGKIVEVGMVKFSTEHGNIVPVLDLVCREEGMTGRDRKAWIFNNSDLTVEEVRAADLLSTLEGKIQLAFDSVDVLTAFNKKFDFEFMRDRGFDIGKEWPCPMMLMMDIMKIPKKGKAAAYKGWKYPNVEEVWRWLFPQYPYVEAHRGLDDATHEASILFEMYKRGWIK